MRSFGMTAVVGVLLLGAIVASAAPQAPTLADGVQQVEEGDFENALFTLDAVIRELVEGGAPSRELAKAYVYCGIAYLGLGQEALAKRKFRLAVRQHPDLQLSPDEFSARVIRVFAAGREAETSAATLREEAKKGKGKGGWILLGLGGAAAVALAATVATRERENSPPTASMTISPEGIPIAGVTVVTFVASSSDPDGDALSYRWRIGGWNAEGPTATYVLPGSARYDVILTVSDGLTTTEITESVTAGTLAGRWRSSGPGFLGETEYRLVNRPTPGYADLTVIFPGGFESRPGNAAFTDPRNVAWNYRGPAEIDRGPETAIEFEGEADSRLETISGTLLCRYCDEHQGEQRPITLRRE